jgi:hypothetical protein
MSSTFTSASDETHPVWPDFPEINGYISRLSYAFSRGEPCSEIAWLFPDRVFPDEMVISGYQGFSAGQGDSPVTTALKAAGLTYDRVNRAGLTGATAAAGRLKIGAADYSGLLVTDLEAASPELLEAMETVSRAGIPVVVLGGLPARAPGWGDHDARDQEVAVIAARLAGEVTEAASPDGLGKVFAAAGVSSPVLTADGEIPFLISRRVFDDGELFLFFNETDQDMSPDIKLKVDGRIARVLDPEDGKAVGGPVEKDSIGCFPMSLLIPSRRAVVVRIEK